MTGPTLRDWFAIHAPADPWPDFGPKLPSEPPKPPAYPVGNCGEVPTDEEEKALLQWLDDPILEPELEYPNFSYWVAQWRRYWEAHQEWEKACQRARREQWPYYYADVMIRERCRDTSAPKKLSRSQLISLLDDIEAQVAASRGGQAP